MTHSPFHAGLTLSYLNLDERFSILKSENFINYCHRNEFAFNRATGLFQAKTQSAVLSFDNVRYQQGSTGKGVHSRPRQESMELLSNIQEHGESLFRLTVGEGDIHLLHLFARASGAIVWLCTPFVFRIC